MSQGSGTVNRRGRVMVAAALAVVVSGGGIAMAATDQSPGSLLGLSSDSGQVKPVTSPTYLAAPAQTRVSAIDDSRLKSAPSSVAASRLEGGGRLVISNDAADVAIGRKKAGSDEPGDICLSVRAADQGATLGGCSTLDAVGQGALWVGDLSGMLAGVAPDGVSQVVITDATGHTQTVPVTNNAYVTKTNGQVARIEWSASNGARADLALPPVTSMPSPGAASK